MTTCSIVGCRTKIRKKQSDLSLHQLPHNKERRKAWLNIIGAENIIMTKRRVYICSIHFEEWCFNRTLNRLRLKDDAIPSKILLPSARPAGIFRERNTTTVPVNTQTIKRKGDFSTEDAVHALPVAKASKGIIMVPTTAIAQGAQPPAKPSTSKHGVIVATKSIAQDAQPLTKASTSEGGIVVPTKSIVRDAQGKTLFLSVQQEEEDIPLHIITAIPNRSDLSKNVENQNQCTRCQKDNILCSIKETNNILKIRLQNDRIKKLRLKIKNMKAIVRRRDKKIAVLRNMITELKNKNLINNERSMLFEESAGPKDFLKRQVATSKGLPLEKTTVYCS